MQKTSTNINTSRRQVLFLPPGLVTKTLAGIIAALLLANLVSIYYESFTNIESKFLSSLSRSFDFNEENNVPTFFSSVILLIAAGLLFLIYSLRKDDQVDGRKWQLLGFVVLFIAIDETVQIHEFVADVVRPRLVTDLGGLLHWAWVVPYGALVLAVAAYFLKFVLRLPILTRGLFLLSGCMFVAGAIGLELLEGYFYKRYGLNHIYNKGLYCAEELLEMSAVVVLIYALLRYLTSLKAKVYIASPDNTAAATAPAARTTFTNEEKVWAGKEQAADV